MTLLTSLLLLLPWVLLVRALFPQWTLRQSLVVGCAGGLAATITLGHLLASFGRLELLFYFLPAVLLVAAVIVLRRSRALGRALEELLGPKASTAASVWFTVVLATIAGMELIPALTNTLPLGWDPSFHAILAEKIRLSGALSVDWTPFEEIPLNYPQGTHLLMALAARLSSLPVHTVFLQLLVLVQVLAAALLALVAERVFEDWRAGVGTLISYGFLVRWGGFGSYFQWGGLPTALGALLLLGLVWLTLTERNRLGVALGAVFLGSTLLTHHLSALIAGWIGALYLLLETIEWVAAKKGTRWGADGQSSYWVKVGLLTLVAYSYFLIPYFLKIQQLSETAALEYSEEPLIRLQQLPMMLGWVLAPLSLAGLVLSRRFKSEHKVFLLIWTTALFFGFCLLDDVYRFLANLLQQRDFTAFTPSRFLTLMSYPLAIYAGYALARLQTVFPETWAIRLPFGQRLSARGVVLVVLVGASTAHWGSSLEHLSSQAVLPKELVEVASMLKEQTPPNAFLLFNQSLQQENVYWMAYLTWRRSPETPIPASESQKPAKEYERLFTPPVDPQAIDQWLAHNNLVGLLLARNPQGNYFINPLSPPEGGP